MENLANNVQEEHSLTGNAAIRGYLIETAKWGKFLAIVGFVGVGFLVLLAIFMMIGFSVFSKLPQTRFPMWPLGFLYIVLAVVYFYPVNYLYQYAVQIRKGLEYNNMPTIISGFRNLKSLFKFMGILMIVLLSLYGVILLIAAPVLMFLKQG